MEETTSKLVKLNIFDGQNVIIPDHIQVPDAVKSVLSFGTINAREVTKNVNIKNVHSTREAAPEEVTDNSPSRSVNTNFLFLIVILLHLYKSGESFQIPYFVVSF